MKKSLAEIVKSKYNNKSQIKTIEMSCGKFDLTIFYIESITDKKLFSAAILAPLNEYLKNTQLTIKEIKDDLQNNIFSIYSVEKSNDETQVLKKILSGNVAVVVGDIAFLVPIFSAEKRSIDEPPTSRVIKGPREGFVEELFANTGLVRKRLKTPNLQIENLIVGKQTNTEISVFYLNGIAKEDIVEGVISKLKTIDVDGVIDSYYVETFITENKIKFFRRVGNTEKPDIFCAKLLEGRVGIIVDGSPIALTVPFVFLEDLQASQDYFTIKSMATFARIMRLVGLFFAILAPGIYVAMQSFNYRIFPINFLISILASIEGLSIPPLVEVLIVLFLFEIITEASMQMPNSLGIALSIIGALALGNTAVDAGIISPPSIVIVAISSVAIYIIPDEIPEARILRVLFTAMGGIIGLYGIMVSLIILTSYMSSIESYGIPYFEPMAPSIKLDKKDGLIKQDLNQMKLRPHFFASKNKTRQSKRGGV